MPQGIDHMDEVVTYFESLSTHTFVVVAAGLDGIARTTNCVEGWHYGLQLLFQCHHPTVWQASKSIYNNRRPASCKVSLDWNTLKEEVSQSQR